MTQSESSPDTGFDPTEAELGGVEPERAGDMPITVTDKRVIDPDTGEVRPGAHPAAEPNAADERVAELTADLQREGGRFQRECSSRAFRGSPR